MIFTLAALAGLMASMPAYAAARSCLTTTTIVEKRENIPRGLLYAIALAESGRWNKQDGSTHAWPWTVRAAADGFVVDNKDDAIEIVENLRRDGRKNIDVGCMQINLRYHPQAFPNLETAFEPMANVNYAAQFLKQLRKESKSWQKAVEWYHSRKPTRGKDYRARVYKHWQSAQIEINQAHRDLAISNREMRKTTMARSRTATTRLKSTAASHIKASLVQRTAPVLLLRGKSKIGKVEPRHSANTQDATTSNLAKIQAGAIPMRENAKRPAIHGLDILRPKPTTTARLKRVE